MISHILISGPHFTINNSLNRENAFASNEKKISHGMLRWLHQTSNLEHQTSAPLASSPG
jgi:hypothetical protein